MSKYYMLDRVEEKLYDVVALGELLIDFLSVGTSDYGNVLFEACPGGAPCNVLAMLAKLGRKTAFVGKLGGDLFGYKLKNVIEGLGIDSRGIVFDDAVNTTLAFVSNDNSGERSFAFCRNPGADMMLSRDEVNEELIEKGRIFHFGTLSTTHPQVREATRAAVNIAKKSGALISFDPNLRPLLWESLQDAKEQMAWGCSMCDILKISDDEAEFLTGENGAQDGAKTIKKLFPDIKLIFVTSGKEGSAVLYSDMYLSEPAFKSLKVIDTTGAGDTFYACCLDAVLREGLEDVTEEYLRTTLRYANAAAGIITTRKGAMMSMPDKSDIQELLYGKCNV